jgi:hypothetical protein
MAITGGSLLNSVPAPTKATLQSNYLDLANSTNAGWSQQYIPDLMEKEAEVFGPRTISGFLSKVGAEEAMQADQVVWSEQGRLHLSYTGEITDGDAGTVAGGQITLAKDIDGVGLSGNNHGIRINDLVIVASSEAVAKCIVTKTNVGSSYVIEVAPYGAATLNAAGFTDDQGTNSVTVLVYGSEYRKGDNYQGNSTRQANEPDFKSFSNKPIILKDYYEVSGSDTSKIGWVEVSTEAGQNGFLWYLKAESDTRARFTDYLEMAMLEATMGGDASDVMSGAAVAADDLVDDYLEGESATFSGALHGTQGLFDAITTRGNVTSGVTGVNAATDLAEFDAILAEFDKQGAIEEYMMFVNRSTSLAIDDMLASMNSYGAGGTSYGVFDNSEDMALNLGFSGFRRGSYDFYKSDFRYLNDKATRGGINDAAGANAIRGVMIPAGVSTVYDQAVGKNIKRPFLHVRYRASQTDNRKMKTWTTGSVGAATSALDAMQLHFLSERCLITQGANNFMLMQ